jgi:hypothetical protein
MSSTAGRERAASAAQYVLLGGFAAVASGISSQGLTGFARSNMALAGPWPYLLFFSLDGAAGVCAVLLARRAARSEGSAAPRLAVWGLVAASATFNWTHAPRRPEAPEAYALMPIVAAVLFEFCLQETRARRAQRPGRRLSALRWLRPAERVRIHLLMSASGTLSADEATRRVRVEAAARALYRLRTVTRAGVRDGAEAALAARRSRRALRRAHAALTAAGFADPDVAAEVLGGVQVLTMTAALATLDYASAEAAHAAIGNMITSGARPEPGRPPAPAHDAASGPQEDAAGSDYRPLAAGEPGTAAPPNLPGPQTATAVHASAVPPQPQETTAMRGQGAAGLDEQLIEAAKRIAAEAAGNGTRLSQAALAEKLRGEGRAIANDRLSWLAAAIGLGPRRG